MDIKKIDPRNERTKDALQTALLDVLQDRVYEAITIQDITDTATMGRATFYRHYRDKDELLVDCLQRIFREVISQSVDLSIEGIQRGEPDSPILLFYQKAAKNYNLFRALFTQQAASIATQTMRRIIADYVLRNLDRILPIDSTPFPRPLLAGHLSAVMVGDLVWWVENNMPYTPRYMAEAVTWLSMFGVLGMSKVDLHPPDLPSIE